MEYLPMAMWLGVYGTAIASVPAMARLKFMKGAFQMKLTNLILAASLFGIVDVVNDNMIAIEVAQAGIVTVIHADTTGTGCIFKEGQAIPIQFESENSFVITCEKTLDKPSLL